jgi:outer membrane protein OmpA-like peptidoglycan-associated protein
MINKVFIFIIICSTLTKISKAQLVIDTSLTPKQIVEMYLVGQHVKVGKVSYTGNKLAIARIAFKNTPIDIKKGILLCTGSVYNAQGPNKYPYTTTSYLDIKTQKQQKGDKDLNRIAHNYSYDAAILEFDFIPTNNKISFKYCFGSEEYPEYVGSRYNDVFGFFITGPKYKSKNLATLPLSIEPITVNTINAKQNKKAFVDNDFFDDVKQTKVMPGQSKKKSSSKTNKKTDIVEDEKVEILFNINKRKKSKLNQAILNNVEYDGLTRGLVAWCYVIPYQKYHIKIAIADVGDNSYDSGVFLEEGSFVSDKDVKMPHFKEYKDVSKSINFDSLLYGMPPKKGIAKPAKPIINQDSIDEAESDFFQITNINFESDSYAIPDSSQKHLLALVAYLHKHPLLKLQLYGYTDNKGNKEYNQQLSINRAESVTKFLVAKGLLAKQIKFEGLNFERPAADNSSEVGRSRNRRVEISIDDSDEKKAANQKVIKKNAIGNHAKK